MSKQEFLSEMQAKLKEFDVKMAQLSARPKPKGEHARLEREKTYYFLKAKRDEIRDQMKLVEKATEEAAGAFKTSMKRIYDDMVRVMDDTCNSIDGPEQAGLI